MIESNAPATAGAGLRAIFLDYGTVSCNGDLDASSLLRALPALELRSHTPQDAVPEAIADASVVMLNKARLDRAALEGAPSLKLVLLSATGTTNVDLEAARERSIAVCNLRDYCTASVVQHVLGVVLLLTHGLREYDALVRTGAWQRGEQFCLLDHPIRELAGRRIGIVGYGTLGRAVARAANLALGMEVLVADRPGGARVTGRHNLDEMLPKVDVLSLHCPLTEQTRGLIGEARLSAMKPDALLVNTARGALVDSRALVAALRAGRLGGAAIDVLSQEPPVEGDPLLDPGVPNLIVTPHVAWAARDARQRCLDEMALNVDDFLRGGHRNRVV